MQGMGSKLSTLLPGTDSCPISRAPSNRPFYTIIIPNQIVQFNPILAPQMSVYSAWILGCFRYLCGFHHHNLENILHHLQWTFRACCLAMNLCIFFHQLLYEESMMMVRAFTNLITRKGQYRHNLHYCSEFSWWTSLQITGYFTSTEFHPNYIMTHLFHCSHLLSILQIDHTCPSISLPIFPPLSLLYPAPVYPGELIYFPFPIQSRCPSQSSYCYINSLELMITIWLSFTLHLMSPYKPCALIYHVCLSGSELPHSE